MSDDARLGAARAALRAAEEAARAAPAPAPRGRRRTDASEREQAEPVDAAGEHDGAPPSGATPRRVRGGRGGRRRPRHGAEPPADRPREADADPHHVARQIVLRQLTAAPRSRAELEAKLASRGCEEHIAREVLDRMEEVGLVDDEEYAGMLVRSRRETRGLGHAALRTELARKGIDPEVAQSALGEVDDRRERAAARALVDKRLRQLHGLDSAVQMRRLAGMLARKGYSSGLAYAVIRDAIADSEEHRRD